MPKFILPELPEAESESDTPVAATNDSAGDKVWPSRWERSIRIPINKKILETLEISKDAQVTLRGDITSLSSQSEAGEDRQYLELVIDSVEAYQSQEVDEEEAMEAGYKGEKA